MIVGGKADVAAIDCVTFELLRKTAPALIAAVRVLTWSAASPGLPLVTASATNESTVKTLRAALADVVADPVVTPVLDTLLIDGFDTLVIDAYEHIVAIERYAHSHGYPELI
jgi:ABC-type phosphate/phosphonate transport system substrate-binding protein